MGSKQADMAEVRVVTDDEEYEDALSVRYRVFVDEQGVDPDIEVDDHEEAATHFVAYEEGEPVGVARLRAYEGEQRRDGTAAKVERVAVLEDYRERGIGREVMNALEARAREEGLDRATLHSQTRAAGFYERLGYEQVGEEFEEAGIPHVAMEKSL